MGGKTSIFANVWFEIPQTNMSHFQTLEIVGRGGETQFQVGENFFC